MKQGRVYKFLKFCHICNSFTESSVNLSETILIYFSYKADFFLMKTIISTHFSRLFRCQKKLLLMDTENTKVTEK